MIYGVGYNSKGKYPTKINGKYTKCYETWKHMLRRCFSPKLQEKYPTYVGCEVCEQWLDFQVFAEWYYDNYYEIEGERIELDKDILVKNNKLYSPTTCIFVSHRINSLFTKRTNKRGKSPIGVVERKNKNKNKNRNGYQVYCNNGNDKLIYLGMFPTVHEAFLMYKINKELVIQSVAEEYKDKIPSKLYEAMVNYKIEEGD